MKRLLLVSILAFAALAFYFAGNGKVTGGLSAVEQSTTSMPIVSSETDTTEGESIITGENAAERSLVSEPPLSPNGTSTSAARLPITPNMNLIPRLLTQDEWRTTMNNAKQGDRLALEDLYEDLVKCKGVPRNEIEMQAAISRQLSDESEELSVRQKFAAFQQERYQRCQMIPPDVRTSFDDELFALRADLGGNAEKLDYLQRGMPLNDGSLDYPDERRAYEERARGYLDGMISSGDPKGLEATASSYIRGLAHPRDLSRAYVYTYAYALTQGESTANITQRLVALERNLVPGTLAPLQEEAQRIATCCR